MGKFTISEIPTTATTPLTGAEMVEIEQGGVSKKVAAAHLGGVVAVVAKTADFTANGASGTIYTNEGAAGAVEATLPDSAIGTKYTFYQDGGFSMRVYPDTGLQIKLYSIVSVASQEVPGAGDWVEPTGDGDSFEVTKITATVWAVTVVNGAKAND